MFSVYIIEVHGDFECISIGDPMLAGSKQLEVDLRSNHCQGLHTPVFRSDFLCLLLLLFYRGRRDHLVDGLGDRTLFFELFMIVVGALLDLLRALRYRGSARLFFSHDFLLSDQASGFASDSFCFR